MTTELPRHQTLRLFRAGAALRWRTPLWTRTAVTAIHGRPRVEEVELTDLDSGATRSLACDTVVFTGDWIPDHELAVMGGLAMDPGTRGPARRRRAAHLARRRVRRGQPSPRRRDGRRGRAERPPRGGRSGGDRREEAPGRRGPSRSSASRRSAGSAPARSRPERTRRRAHRYLLRSQEFVRRPHVEVVQDGRSLWAGRLPKLVPGRSARLAWTWTEAVDQAGGPVRVRLASHG